MRSGAAEHTAEEIIKGKRLTQEDDVSFLLTEDLDALRSRRHTKSSLRPVCRALLHYQWAQRALSGKLQILCPVRLLADQDRGVSFFRTNGYTL